MSNTNKEVSAGSECLIRPQQRKRKGRANTNDAENTQPNSSVPLSDIFPRVLTDISTPNKENGKQQNAQGKRLKSNSSNLICNIFICPPSSNQTTQSNIFGGSTNVSTALKRKRSATIDVSDHTPSTFSRKKRAPKSGVLTDITNVLPTSSTMPFQFGTPSTTDSCVTKISTKAKGKGKVLAGENKFKSKTITKSCRKTLESQFNGCVHDNSSSEDDEDQTYQCDYEEESELYTEQVYDCSSEESDRSDSETIREDPMLSEETDQRLPDVLSKTNRKTVSSSTRITKAKSSRKEYGTQFV
ncbi:hypothetical protein Rs2_35789 [Raphanus sativus]|nr:hypothetical protein Rs2_35789 [Raphanus sativus]